MTLANKEFELNVKITENEAHYLSDTIAIANFSIAAVFGKETPNAASQKMALLESLFYEGWDFIAFQDTLIAAINQALENKGGAALVAE